MTTSTQTAQIYAVDPIHTSVEFVVRHLMISKVRGRFGAVSGTFAVEPGSHVPTSIEAILDVDSIATGDPQRDGHLASPDFFDAATYPQISFSGSHVVAAGDEFEVHGKLTIKETTLPIVLKATYGGQATDAYGNSRIGFEAHATISRKAFGLVWNQALETGGVAIGDEVKIELAVEGVAQKA